MTSTDSIALLGIPLDANSSHLVGPAKGPAAIRRVLHSGSGNHVSEAGVDAIGALDDLGDIEVENVAGSILDADLITERVAEVVNTGQQLICLGGDHSVTFPILRGFARYAEHLTVVHLSLIHI